MPPSLGIHRYLSVIINLILCQKSHLINYLLPQKPVGVTLEIRNNRHQERV